MTRNEVLEAVKAMPEGERYDLVMELWDVVESDFKLTCEQKQELDRRIAADDADSTPLEDWSILRDKLLRGEI